MIINYFIEHEGKLYAYRKTSKFLSLTKKNYGKYHRIVEIPEEEILTIKKKYPQISYRTLNDDRIPKYLKNKIKYFDGPFSYTSIDSSILNSGINQGIIGNLSVDDILEDMLEMKKDKMRKIIISKIKDSRDFIEGGNNWLVYTSVKEFHNGRISVLKELLETTD